MQVSCQVIIRLLSVAKPPQLLCALAHLAGDLVHFRLF